MSYRAPYNELATEPSYVMSSMGEELAVGTGSVYLPKLMQLGTDVRPSELHFVQ